MKRSGEKTNRIERRLCVGVLCCGAIVMATVSTAAAQSAPSGARPANPPPSARPAQPTRPAAKAENKVADVTATAKNKNKDKKTNTQARRKSRAGTGRLVGQWPAETPKITLRQAGSTVGEALRALAKKARWDLMLAAPKSLVGRPITIEVKRRPAAQVLEIVLMQGGLQAELKNNALVVTPRGRHPSATRRTDPSPTESGAAAARKSSEDEKGERRESDSGLSAAADLKQDRALDAKDPKDRAHEGKPKKRRSRRERVTVGNSLRIKKNEVVDSAVAIGGSVTVLGVVNGEAVAIGGSVTLEPGAVVKGEAVAIGGKVEVKPGARLDGDRVSIGGSLKGAIDFFTGVATGSVAWFLYSVVGTFVRALILFLLALMIVSFMPQRLERIQTYMSENPGSSVLGGIGVAIGFVPLCVLLAITIIGILLIPFALLALIAIHVVGLTAFMVWLGYKIPLFQEKKTPIVAMTMGLVVITLIDLIPVLGSLLVTAIAFVAAGAVLLSKLGAPTPTVAPAGGPKNDPATGPHGAASGPMTGSGGAGSNAPKETNPNDKTNASAAKPTPTQPSDG